MESAIHILKELEALGSAQTKKIYLNHGAPDNLYGVKVGDLKGIVKRIKKDYQLAIDLYNTGNGDAMYLAGLIGDEKKMTKADLNKWAKKSSWYMISEYTVPFVAAESPYGWELANEWINSNRENVASAGWATLSGIVSTIPDERLDMKALSILLDIVAKDIHQSANRVRHTMNGFVIATGCYVKALSSKAREVAGQIGKLHVEMGDTACKVPDAIASIKKMESGKGIGMKRKTARC
jgi:3-methyladenine DNA glycosylase AlkD